MDYNYLYMDIERLMGVPEAKSLIKYLEGTRDLHIQKLIDTDDEPQKSILQGRLRQLTELIKMLSNLPKTVPLMNRGKYK